MTDALKGLLNISIEFITAACIFFRLQASCADMSLRGGSDFHCHNVASFDQDQVFVAWQIEEQRSGCT